MKGGIGFVEKYSFVIATNLTSICCVIRRKLLKTNHTELKNVASTQIQKVEIFDSDRKKNQFNSKQIILIFQTIVIDNFTTHSYKVDIS